MDNLAIVDLDGVPLADPSGTAVGLYDPAPDLTHGRMVQALPLGFSGLARRYSSHPPAESALFGIDLSPVVPGSGVTILQASVVVFVNAFVSDPSPSPDWTIGPVTINAREVYARMTGGIEGTDYQARWTVSDSDGNVWVRTALVLCAETS